MFFEFLALVVFVTSLGRVAVFFLSSILLTIVYYVLDKGRKRMTVNLEV